MINLFTSAARCISIEPVMVTYYIALTLANLNNQNLLLQKACNPGVSAPPLGASCPDELQSQKLVTNIQTWKDLIVEVGPVFFVLFAGPWSDNHGKRRKPLMYLPLFGQILADSLSIFNVYSWSWSPVVAALSSSIPPALTGWRPCFMIGAHSYITDITADKSRTVRLGMCVALYFLGFPIGAFFFGLLFHSIGFYGVFLMCVILNMLAIVYLFFLISENHLVETNLEPSKIFVDMNNILQSLRTTLKPRVGYKRCILLLAILVAPLTLSPLQGEYAVLYFFLRFKFHWDEVDFGFYAGYKSVVIFCGTLVTLGLFSRLLGMSDPLIGVLASCTLIAASLGNAFCSYTWQLFVYPLVDFMHGAGLAVVLSIASKNIESTELGQVNSMIGVADALLPILNMPLYNQVYHHTFTTIPGAFFLISMSYGVIALFVFGIIYVLQRLQDRRKEDLS